MHLGCGICSGSMFLESFTHETMTFLCMNSHCKQHDILVTVKVPPVEVLSYGELE